MLTRTVPSRWKHEANEQPILPHRDLQFPSLTRNGGWGEGQWSNDADGDRNLSLYNLHGLPTSAGFREESRASFSWTPKTEGSLRPWLRRRAPLLLVWSSSEQHLSNRWMPSSSDQTGPEKGEIQLKTCLLEVTQLPRNYICCNQPFSITLLISLFSMIGK